MVLMVLMMTGRGLSFNDGWTGRKLVEGKGGGDGRR